MRQFSSLVIILVMSLPSLARADARCETAEVRDSGPCARAECRRDAHPCAADSASEQCQSTRSEFEALEANVAGCKAQLEGRAWKGITEGLDYVPEHENLDRDYRRELTIRNRLITAGMGGAVLLAAIWWLRRTLRKAAAESKTPPEA